MSPNFPVPDPDRKSRIVDDVIGLMNINRDQVRERVGRWADFTLAKIQPSTGTWWFCQRLFSWMAYPGQDVFDLKKGFDRAISLHGPEHKLINTSMEQIVSFRNQSSSSANSGIPRIYCVYAGQLHLYPAPDQSMQFHLCYSTPLSFDNIPDDFEPIIIDGIIGLYGAHFDKSGIIGEPMLFSQRFYDGLKLQRQRNGQQDVTLHGNFTSISGYRHGETISSKMAEINRQPYGNGETILTPAFQGSPGNAQITGSAEVYGMPFVQIPGDYQP